MPLRIIDFSTVNTSIVPSSNITYDLGTANNAWKDLYLSGNTIVLGGATISTDASSGSITLVPKVTGSNPHPKATIISAAGVASVNTTNGSVSSEVISSAAPSGASITVYANTADLPLANNDAGSQAYVTETNRLFMWTGTGWYNIALINQSPTITVNSAASYTLTAGANTVIELAATDPEDAPITWSYSVTSGQIQDTSVVASGNTFTIVPGTVAATFSLTFTASDGINTDTSTSSFSLTFGFLGDDVLANISTEYTNQVIADTTTTDKVLIYGDTPGRMVYHELEASSTTWRKSYTDYLTWSSSNKYRAVAFDANYIYHVFSGKWNTNQVYAGVNVTKLSKTNGTIVGTSYNYMHAEVASSNFFEYVDCAVDSTNGLLYFVGMTTQSRMHVQALNIGDFSYNWARGKTLNTTGKINQTGAQNCLAVHNSKLAILSDQGSNGVVLEVLSSTGNYVGGVCLTTSGTRAVESLYYYDGKYYCLYGIYNGSTYANEPYLAVVDASNFSVLGNVKLLPNNTTYYSYYSKVYVDSSGIYVGTLRYLMKLNHSLGAVGSWLTTSNGSSLVTPYAWSFNNGNFYFGFNSGTNFNICGGPLDGTAFDTQFDTFNLVPQPLSVTSTSTTSSFSGSYNNIGAQGYVSYSSAVITTTDYANYSVS